MVKLWSLYWNKIKETETYIYWRDIAIFLPVSLIIVLFIIIGYVGIPVLLTLYTPFHNIFIKEYINVTANSLILHESQVIVNQCDLTLKGFLQDCFVSGLAHFTYFLISILLLVILIIETNKNDFDHTWSKSVWAAPKPIIKNNAKRLLLVTCWFLLTIILFNIGRIGYHLHDFGTHNPPVEYKCLYIEGLNTYSGTCVQNFISHCLIIISIGVIVTSISLSIINCYKDCSKKIQEANLEAVKLVE